MHFTSKVVCFLWKITYFIGKWRDEFKPENTKPGDFSLLNGGKSETKFMNGKKKCLYTEFDGMKAKVVKIPFRSHDLLIALPNDADGLPALMEQLFSPSKDEKNLQSLCDREGFRFRDVLLSLPKFSIDGGNLELQTILTKLGLESLFSPAEADFSGIAGNRDLFVSNVFHQAKIDVS